jgi:hypothetical protein
MNTPESVFGDVISTYTRQQAIEDGVLIDMMQGELGQVSRLHYKYPIVCTMGVFALIRRAVEHPDWENDYCGVLHDILTMSKSTYAKKLDRSTVLFEVRITGTGCKCVHSLRLVVGPGDDMEPVITIMLPNED